MVTLKGKDMEDIQVYLFLKIKIKNLHELKGEKQVIEDEIKDLNKKGKEM